MRLGSESLAVIGWNYFFECTGVVVSVYDMTVVGDASLKFLIFRV